MNKIIPALATAATLFAASITNAAAANPVSPTDAMIDHVVRSQEVAAAMAPIRSASDLARYLARAQSDRDNPFNALSERGRQRFLASLRFSNKGLASFGYVELESALTASQAYRLLGLFGAQQYTPQLRQLRQANANDRLIMQNVGIEEPGGEGGYTLLREHRCSAPATCSASTGDVCIIDRC